MLRLQQKQFIYKFRLHKGLVPQIATKLVEAGQEEHQNVMKKKITVNYKHAGKQKNLTLHNNTDVDKAMHQN